MGTSKAKKIELAKRRKKVAHLYLQGYSQRLIAEEVDYSVGTVNRDLNYIKDQWQKSALLDMNKRIERELARLNDTERFCWEMLEQSREATEKTKKKMKEVVARADNFRETDSGGLEREKVTGDRQPTEREIQTTTQEQKADPRWMNQILDIQEKRRRLLGVYDYDPSSEGGRLEEMVDVIEQSVEETDLSQFDDEEIT